MVDKDYFKSVDPLKRDGPTRTDIHCHSCNHNFVAELDFRLEGNHIIECPHCMHRHYRVIQDGKVTEERHDHDSEPNRNHKPLRVWKDGVLPIRTSVASEFIRSRWLDKSI